MDRIQFSELVGAFMTAEMERLFERVPGARQLADDTASFNEDYYLRHRIETVKRIWLTSHTDALALAHMVNEDYESARWWSKYIYQELNHDRLYLADLKMHGITLEQVAATEVFPSTLAMAEYIRRQLPRIGSIAAVSYSVWVEWNSDKTSALVVERAAQQYSDDHVKGANAHVGIDINEDHYEVMLDVVFRLVQRNGGDATAFFDMLRQLTNFVAAYFEELQAASESLSYRSLSHTVMI